MTSTKRWRSIIAAAALMLATVTSARSADDRETFFESKVRPLLVEKCVECHGADEQAGSLRLDLRPPMDATKIVVPGNPDDSRLVHAIRYTDSSFAMPPDAKLEDPEIQILTEWVSSGAYWPKGENDPASETMLPPAKRIDQFRDEHWSFRPITAPTPPQVADEKWIQQPLDRFIAAKLSTARLTPSQPADKRTLILRAHFVLTGLPPTYQEIQAFVADESGDAFERLIDRLLDSPHYGERWARHWLDIARFAETTGYLPGSVDTTYPYAYTYRDYVIDAFNSDKPFDQFVVEQIAADRLDLKDGQRSALAALGFLTTGRSFMNKTQDIIDDRIDVISRGFLGLSVTCARCHDHKYDPIPTADYYSLYGVFASCSAPDELPLIGDPQANPKYEEFLAAKADKEREVAAWLEEKRVATEAELRARVGDYLIYCAKTRPNSGHSDVKQIGDRGALRPQATRRWKEYLDQQSKGNDPIWSLWTRLSELPADGFQEQATALLAAGENKDWLSQVHAGLLAALRAEPLPSMEAAAKIFGSQLESADAAWKSQREKDKNATRLPDDNVESLRAALYAANVPTLLDADLMRSHLDQAERNTYNQQLSKVKAVESKHPGAPGRAMVLNDNGRPVEPVIFLRGQPGNRGDRVPRRFLQVLSMVDGGQPFTDGSGRLELARAIASPKNPLTARVIVNRVWQQHFGYGLVRSASDFGVRGEAPTHPELLDYLASEFMRDGWSIKRLQRRIMLSATWQQSSAHRAEGHAVDPENRLLWHMPRKRLEFEPLRDRWLTASGNLDLTVGGRSVKVHEDATRRGLYAYVDREDVPALLAAFDVPSPDASQATRSRTTVPQQALYMINSKFLIDQARALVGKLSTQSDLVARVTELYRHTLARNPDAAELELAKLFLDPNHPPLPGIDPASAKSLTGGTTWLFGYGSVDDSGHVQFTRLPHLEKDRWQVGSKFPDAQLGHLMLGSGSGHPGNSLEYSTIIRWTAPGKATVAVSGILKHSQEQGDGVQGLVVSSRSGVVGDWPTHNAEVATAAEGIAVEAGDTIDFVVRCQQSPTHDSYRWAPSVRVVQSDDSKLEVGVVWDAASDFDEASKLQSLEQGTVDPWVQLAQVLLICNEFAFVD